MTGEQEAPPSDTSESGGRYPTALQYRALGWKIVDWNEESEEVLAHAIAFVSLEAERMRFGVGDTTART